MIVGSHQKSMGAPSYFAFFREHWSLLLWCQWLIQEITMSVCTCCCDNLRYQFSCAARFSHMTVSPPKKGSRHAELTYLQITALLLAYFSLYPIFNCTTESSNWGWKATKGQKRKNDQIPIHNPRVWLKNTKKMELSHQQNIDSNFSVWGFFFHFCIDHSRFFKRRNDVQYLQTATLLAAR
jgi:hypothetical protein